MLSVSCIVVASDHGIYTALTFDKPNRICSTGMIVANEKSDNIVDSTLKKRFAATCQRYGGMKRRRRDCIFIMTIYKVQFTIL